MKKKIIITALSLMIASSTIIPAYAALPEGAPAVDVETGTMEDIRNSIRQWASQYDEELKAIPDIKDRYRRMCELVITDFPTPVDGSYEGLDVIIPMYNEGVPLDNERYAFYHWAEATGTPCGAERILFNDLFIYFPYIKIDDVKYYSIMNTLRSYGMDDEYMFVPAGKYGITKITSDEGGIYSKVFTEPDFVRTGSYRLRKTIVVYDEDRTCRDLLSKHMLDTSFDLADYITGDSNYYRASGGVFTPITREELVALGYQGTL